MIVNYFVIFLLCYATDA